MVTPQAIAATNTITDTNIQILYFLKKEVSSIYVVAFQTEGEMTLVSAYAWVIDKTGDYHW